jgi:hypothetical protein
MVEYRVNYGPWTQANATDCAFDEAQEDFNFTVVLPENSTGL